MNTVLNQILRTKDKEIAVAKKEKSITDLKRMIRESPPLRSFKDAIGSNFGVIAEIKKRSPSMGNMRHENFEQALQVYEQRNVVKAISVITDFTYFGMNHDFLLKAKTTTNKPILNKDFIKTEYAIFQARAYGADAVLLMSAVLRNRDTAQRLFNLARELGMDVLYEAHNKKEIDCIPDGVEIYGINSRNFMSPWILAKILRPLRTFLPLKDVTTTYTTFSLIKYLPKDAIKIAESGITPRNIDSYVINQGYNSALIGTYLLQDPLGVEKSISSFEKSILESGTRIDHEY